MAESDQTITQLRAELVALRQRHAHFEATMARWQQIEDTARFPTFFHELVVIQQRTEALYERFVANLPPPQPVVAEVLGELSSALDELYVAAEAMYQQQEEICTAHQAMAAAQQHYQDLFHFAPDGYLVTCRVGLILEANSAAAALLNLPPPRLIGKPLAVFVDKSDRQLFRTCLQELLQVERRQGWEICLQPRQKAPFPAELTMGVIRNAHGHASALRWLLRDITARKQAEEALEQSYAELEQRVQERTAALRHEMAGRQRAEEERRRLEHEAQRVQHFALLGRLAAGVSHEIRNPLGAVFLHVDLLDEELHAPSPDSPAQIAESLRELRTQLMRLEDLVQDYLSLVRMTHLDCQPDDLGVAVQDWATEMHGGAATRGVVVHLEGLETLGQVAFHAPTLRRAVGNLIQNALEATPPGGTLTLAGQGTAQQVQLQVRDTGSGIPAAQLRQIFEPLYTTKPGGTGLGLYLVQEIVAAHGGQITVQSVERQGTTFTITLPRIAAETSS